MDAGRRTFNPWSWGLYYSSSASLYMISEFTSFIDSNVWWYVPNKATRITLSRVWDPCATARMEGKERLSVASSVAASYRDGAALPSAMT